MSGWAGLQQLLLLLLDILPSSDIPILGSASRKLSPYLDCVNLLFHRGGLRIV